MVTINALTLPSAEYGEEQTIETNLTMSSGNHPLFRRRLARTDRVNQFTILHLTTEEKDDLLDLLEDQYGQVMAIEAGAFGSFNCLLLQEPLQIVQTARCGWDVTFKGLVV